MIRTYHSITFEKNAFAAVMNYITGSYSLKVGTSVRGYFVTPSVVMPTIPRELKDHIIHNDDAWVIPKVANNMALIMYSKSDRMRFFQNDEFI